MSKGGFDIRGWEFTEERNDTEHGKETGLHLDYTLIDFKTF